MRRRYREEDELYSQLLSPVASVFTGVRRKVIKNNYYLSIWIFFPDLLERSADLLLRLFLCEDGCACSVYGVEPQYWTINP
jgi:hypothetical protein